MEAAQYWPAFVRPRPDELFSSWLVRTAHSHSISTREFFGLVWPQRSIDLIDPDVQLCPAVLDTVFHRTGLSPKTTYQMTLLPFEGVLVHRIFSRFTPWILSLGWGKTERVLAGSVYCPQCLKQDAEQLYFRRQWRLASSMVCLLCESQLLDKCPHCGRKVVYGRNEAIHLSRYRVGQCNYCQRSVTKADYCRATDDQIQIQTTINDQLQLKQGNHSVSYFEVLRYLIGLLSRKLYLLRPLQIFLVKRFNLPLYQGPPVAPLEQLSIQLRFPLLQIASWLQQDWPHLFLDVCRFCRILPAALGTKSPTIPSAISTALDMYVIHN